MAVCAEQYALLIKNELGRFVEKSGAVGDPVTSMAKIVQSAFSAQLEFINFGLRSPRPKDPSYCGDQLQKLNKDLTAIQDFRNKYRSHEFFDHLSAVSESTAALTWIFVDVAPSRYVKEMKDCSEYYGNRVLSKFRGNALHQEWLSSWYTVLTALEAYVKNYHTTGFTWNVLSRDGPVGAAPPPPPPPPPPMDFAAMDSGGQDPGRAALLKELNQGTDITKSLKKVVKGEASTRTVKTPAQSATKPVVAKKVLQPKLELDGRKWVVENQRDNHSLVLEETQINEAIAVYNCANCTLQVKNKVNFISVDTCKKFGIVVHDVISAIEIIHSGSVEVQLNGNIPMVNIDSSESVQIYITDNSKGVEVISSKASSLNICVAKADGDYSELPVPEQIKTIISGGKIVSTIIDKM